jgi:hypothetical protein
MAGGHGVGLPTPTRRNKAPLLKSTVPLSAAALLEAAVPDVNDPRERVRSTVTALQEHYQSRQDTRQAYVRMLMCMLYVGMFLLILVLQRDASACAHHPWG